MDLRLSQALLSTVATVGRGAVGVGKAVASTMGIGKTTAVASAVFVGAGVGHFAKPDFFEAVVPDWFPDKKLANHVSGAAEIALGLGLLPPATRQKAGWGLLALTAAVFPANIDMAINKVDIRPDEDGVFQRYPGEVTDARNWIRLPFQAAFVALIWKGAGLGRS